MNSIIAILLLLIANGFFVAAEFALVKARGFRIETLANEGSASAKMTLHIQKNLEAYLAACQLGITMASLGLGWVGEPAVAAILEPLFKLWGVPEDILHTSAFIVGFLFFSSLHIIVGEQVPKTFAIRKAEPVSLLIAYPLHICYVVSFPLNWLLNFATSSILKLFGVEEVTHAEVLSGEELKGLVATSREHGEIEADKATMLRNMFEFDQRTVSRVMIPSGDILSLDIAGKPAENIRIIRESGHSRFPVISSAKNDEVVGQVLAKDLFSAMLAGESEPWTNLLKYCREPLVVPENQKVSQLFELMRSKRAHMAIVIDEYGDLVGIVTLEDLLEEIVGEIQDETDPSETPTIVAVEENHWEADGLTSQADVERIIGLKVPDQLDANTLSGLCMQRLGRMPEPADVFDEEDFRISVLSIEDRHVGRVHIEKRLASNSLETENANLTSANSKEVDSPDIDSQDASKTTQT